MSANIPPTDEDRWAWLERLCVVSSVSALNAPGGVVVLTCSALKKQYRDILRCAAIKEIETVFLLLQVNEEDSLAERLKNRPSHYMKQDMVHGQVRTLEQPAIEEVDVLPVDASLTPDKVMLEVMDLLRSKLP